MDEGSRKVGTELRASTHGNVRVADDPSPGLARRDLRMSSVLSGHFNGYPAIRPTAQPRLTENGLFEPDPVSVSQGGCF